MPSSTDHRRPGSPGARDWKAEYAELSARDRRTPLDPRALERLAIAAFLAGDDGGSIDANTRAHNLALEQGDTRQAARCAIWVAFALRSAREVTQSAGWVARARRLLEEGGHDSAEWGYVTLLQAMELVPGDLPRAEAAIAEAERIGARFSDQDLSNLARQARGRVLVVLGQAEAGVALLDEAMVAVVAGDVTPIVSGVVYCSVISTCFDVLLDIRRAQEWTQALNDWCESQAGMVPYRGDCLVHRAEILRLRGRWAEALEEARRACGTLAAANRPQGGATYEVAELLRLQGDLAAAEDAYRAASEHGRPPDPGFALLLLAQGRTQPARAAIDRALAQPARGRQRADLLAAAVDISLSAGDLAGARNAARELHTTAGMSTSPWLRAMAAAAAGAVELADGHPREALGPLSSALTVWRDLEAPFEEARVRELLGRACRALGDDEGARLEWQTASHLFRQVGAAPAVARLEALTAVDSPPPESTTSGLTARELEVLRLVACGKQNRVIARDLAISEKTVARHLSNIFVKLDVSSRAAATAYAFTHGLVTGPSRPA